RKAIAALKQSLQFTLPEIEAPVLFEDFIAANQNQNKFIAYTPQKPDDTLFRLAPTLGDYCVLIGPEGGFSESELEAAQKAGFLSVSLGKHRLRSETAALTACLALHHKNQLT
ncbi:MAG: RNA methyltransferase, partial [Bernardetiaceae bacterium]|nr:RNA methyltransferase [Bernardetiaceae bacterium]